jgi:DNA-binding MarR family transcriptional regulator
MPRERPSTSTDPAIEFMQSMWAVDHELQRVSKRMEAAIGLTGPQRFALVLISRFPGVAAGILAAHLHLHPGTVTGIIARLEAARLIERRWDTSDGRRMRLTITRTGQQAVRRRQGTVEEAVRRVIQASSDADHAAAREVLQRLTEALRTVTAAPRGGSRRTATRRTRGSGRSTRPSGRRKS